MKACYPFGSRLFRWVCDVTAVVSSLQHRLRVRTMLLHRAELRTTARAEYGAALRAVIGDYRDDRFTHGASALGSFAYAREFPGVAPVRQRVEPLWI